jgi:hypothetical protein
MMGEICKYCGSRIKEFKIPLSRNNISVLLTIYKLDKPLGFFKTKEIYTKVKSSSPTAEITRLKYLGAIAPYFDVRDVQQKNIRSGKWVITDKGTNFIKKIGSLPSYVIVRNERVIKRGEEISIDNPQLKWHKEADIWKVMKDYWENPLPEKNKGLYAYGLKK